MRKEATIFWQELDQALNTCIFFKRDFKSYKAMDGYYEREGKKCWCKAIWDSYMIDYYLQHPQEIEDIIPHAFPRKEFKVFIDFLIKNKWQKWYKPYDKTMDYMSNNFSKYMVDLLGSNHA